MGYPGVTEMHVYLHHDMVDGLIAAGEQMVINLSDDCPSLSPSDARFIVAANPEIIKRLCAMALASPEFKPSLLKPSEKKRGK